MEIIGYITKDNKTVIRHGKCLKKGQDFHIGRIDSYVKNSLKKADRDMLGDLLNQKAIIMVKEN